jgi:replicative DNA helicase
MTENVRHLPPSSLPPGRIPPHSIDAERSLLGGVLLEGEAFGDVQALVAAQDFYRDAHRKVFEAMSLLFARGEPLDRVTVKAELVKMGSMEDVGGEEFLDVLDQVVPVAPNLDFYARIIREKAQLRRMIEAASRVCQLGYEQHGPATEFLDDAEARIYAARAETQEHAFKKLNVLVKRAFQEIEHRYEHGGDLTGLPSGLEALDVITNGFQRKHLIILGARPSMGKTSLAIDFARAICRTGGGVAFFSVEVSEDEIAQKALAQESRVNSRRLLTGKLEETDWPKLAQGAGVLADFDMHVIDSARTVMEIRSQSRRLASKLAGTPHPLRAVVIDYLQLMDGDGTSDNREGEIAKMSRELKALAKQLDVPVIALSQLNRKCEERVNKRPQLSDLRESGAVEQDADLVMFIYRGEVYGDSKFDAGDADIIVAKQRNGPIGEARVYFEKSYSSFRDARATPQNQAQLPLPPDREEPPAPTERYPDA